ncbi:PREDICTED: protein sym-1-like [Lupinus angustifolius]|uniref:protein sym-1-like n=1 Tax=Lupinus angustifolius TaxID=3871 RepID=UPI00092EBBD9|nr:PREDICTED: protein sym-1-like [Lupinus angustifolius]
MILKAMWTWYQNCLSLHPVQTQVISSCVLWGVADVTAQYITHHASVAKTKKLLQLSDSDVKFMIDWRRVAVTSIFGAGFVGPVGHFWFESLDKFIRLKLHLMPQSARAVATKVAMDGIIFGPVNLFVFFTYMGLCSGKTIPQVKEDIKKNYFAALILESSMWPFVQVFNFRYVPVKYQLLYVNFFCLLDSAFLSWLDQQKDAPWKQWFHSSREKGFHS